MNGFQIECQVQNNSLWPSDAIRRHRSGSTLAQVMACCLTAPSHYLNQCWLVISKVLWHWSEWRHQAITWTNVDLSSVRSCDIDLRAISWETPKPLITKFDLKIPQLIFHFNLPGANEINGALCSSPSQLPSTLIPVLLILTDALELTNKEPIS